MGWNHQLEKFWAYMQHNCKCNSTVTEQWPFFLRKFSSDTGAKKYPRSTRTRWWFQIFFIFTPIWGRWTQFDEHTFQMGWFNHQPENDIGSKIQDFPIQNFCWMYLAVLCCRCFFGPFDFRMWQSVRGTVRTVCQNWSLWFFHQTTWEETPPTSYLKNERIVIITHSIHVWHIFTYIYHKESTKTYR